MLPSFVCAQAGQHIRRMWIRSLHYYKEGSMGVFVGILAIVIIVAVVVAVSTVSFSVAAAVDDEEEDM